MITLCLIILLVALLPIGLLVGTGFFIVYFGFFGAMLIDIAIAVLAIYGLVKLFQKKKEKKEKKSE